MYSNYKRHLMKILLVKSCRVFFCISIDNRKINPNYISQFAFRSSERNHVIYNLQPRSSTLHLRVHNKIIVKEHSVPVKIDCMRLSLEINRQKAFSTNMKAGIVHIYSTAETFRTSKVPDIALIFYGIRL
jgi:hypothetical protein